MMRNRLLLIACSMCLLAIPSYVASAQSLDVEQVLISLMTAINDWIPGLGEVLVIGPAILIGAIIIKLIVFSIADGIASIRNSSG